MIGFQWLLGFPSFHVDLFLGFSSNKKHLCQIDYKNNHNLVNSMWCTYTFEMYENVFEYIKGTFIDSCIYIVFKAH
jgi:hypothetical protein